MAQSGETLEIPELGFRVLLRRTAADTNGAELEIEVTGRPRGFINQEHVHVSQSEHHEVLSGAMKLVLAGQEHILQAGDAMEVPAGAPHRQLPEGSGEGHIRVIVRPAGHTQDFLERLATMSASGDFNRLGLPKLRPAAELIRDFGAEGHASKPPFEVQRILAGLVLKVASGEASVRRLVRSVRQPPAPYRFVDEWDVAASPESVFWALADARTYPEWWTPVYIDVQGEPPAVGVESRQHFKGRLPYHLHTCSRIVRLDPPHVVQAEVDGDLRGQGIWTLTSVGAGTHVRFDWQVHADRPLLRILTPVLRPLFRWNHNWAIARARVGLEPYARRGASGAAREADPPPAAGAHGSEAAIASGTE